MNKIFLTIMISIFTFSALADGRLESIEQNKISQTILRSEASLINELRHYRLLFIPGLATDLTEDLGVITGDFNLTHRKGFLASFYVQMKWARSNGIDVLMSDINRIGSCDQNGKDIIKNILSSDKEVIVISQSKGGVDFLHGLLSKEGMKAGLRKKIHAWLAYQPPFAGSPLADYVNERAPIELPTRAFAKILLGSPESYKQMTLKYRFNFNYYFENEIQKITRDIPLTTLVTHEKGSQFIDYVKNPSENAFLGPLVSLIENKYHQSNDGIAIMAGTCLDLAHCYFKNNLDHFAAVMDTYPYKGISASERLGLFKFLMIKTLENSSNLAKDL